MSSSLEYYVHDPLISIAFQPDPARSTSLVPFDLGTHIYIEHAFLNKNIRFCRELKTASFDKILIPKCRELDKLLAKILTPPSDTIPCKNLKCV